MKRINTRRGFTLIELLVVVLIIGILASVALPQYKKAVDKSRYATLMAYVEDLTKAQEVYYLANGKYTDDIAELDIEWPQGQGIQKDSAIMGNMQLDISLWYTAGFYIDSEGQRIASYVRYYQYRDSTVKHVQPLMCFNYTAYRDRGTAICKAFGGEKIFTDSSCTGGAPCDYFALK